MKKTKKYEKFETKNKRNCLVMKLNFSISNNTSNENFNN